MERNKKRIRIRLGVNIDHVATLRQTRQGVVPDTVRAAREAVRGGADGITIHLREDRRHIQDFDILKIKKAVEVPINLEMALSDDIIRVALSTNPQHVCLVPEKRQELTTEGGLDVRHFSKRLKKVLAKFKKNNIQTSLFIDPDPRQIQEAARIGADAVELHTGCYANARGAIFRRRELLRLRKGARLAFALGLQVHAGHGLDHKNVKDIAAIPEIEELNIGHSLVAESIFSGLCATVQDMKGIIHAARKRIRK